MKNIHRKCMKPPMKELDGGFMTDFPRAVILSYNKIFYDDISS
jgi:hypothetical protein